jgi:group I intron endonuclease
MKKYTVYLHTNLIDGKRYVGITSRKTSLRWGVDGRGYKHNSNSHFWNAIKKHGWSNFSHEVLNEGLTLEEAFKMEHDISERFQTTNPEFGYNMMAGTGGNFSVSEETRKKFRETRRGENNRMYGRKHSEETKAKLVFVNTRNAKYGKENQASRGVIGKRVSDGEEIFFESANQAALKFNLFNNSHIIECCRGSRKKCVGYHWRYTDNGMITQKKSQLPTLEKEQ